MNVGLLLVGLSAGLIIGAGGTWLATREAARQARLTADGVTPSWRAAPEKLPASTTRANTAISDKLSSGLLMLIAHK